MPRLLALALVVVVSLLLPADARQAARPLFEFRVSFWNSLHHELQAVARPRPAPAPAQNWPDDLPEAALAGWTRALDVYRPLAKRSLLFDEGLATLSALLVHAVGELPPGPEW